MGFGVDGFIGATGTLGLKPASLFAGGVDGFDRDGDARFVTLVQLVSQSGSGLLTLRRTVICVI